MRGINTWITWTLLFGAFSFAGLQAIGEPAGSPQLSQPMKAPTQQGIEVQQSVPPAAPYSVNYTEHNYYPVQQATLTTLPGMNTHSTTTYSNLYRTGTAGTGWSSSSAWSSGGGGASWGHHYAGLDHHHHHHHHHKHHPKHHHHKHHHKHHHHHHGHHKK